jgi:hypothetical protein
VSVGAWKLNLELQKVWKGRETIQEKEKGRERTVTKKVGKKTEGETVEEEEVQTSLKAPKTDQGESSDFISTSFYNS